MKIIVQYKKKIVIIKNNIAIRIAGKVSRYIDTVVPVFSNPLDERPPAVNDHVINVQKIVNVNVPQISVHLPNADADSNPLVIRICYKGQCKQIPCFRRPCYAKIARDRYNLR